MSLCILTDSTALFPPNTSSSGQLIRVISVHPNGQNSLFPMMEDYTRTFNDLERTFNDILVMTSSQSMISSGEIAQVAAQSHGGTAKISILDTRQIGPGLGILAQLAARKSATGATMHEVEDYVRSIIPYIFTIVMSSSNPQDLDGRKQFGSERPSEKANGAQVYVMEDGLLAPYKKIRTQRHLLEIFQEFLGEFEKPKYLAYFHGINSGLHARHLREAASGLFPGANFNDIEFNQTLGTILGEYSSGLTILEMPEHQRI